MMRVNPESVVSLLAASVIIVTSTVPSELTQGRLLKRAQMVINGVVPGMQAAAVRRLHGDPASVAPVVQDPRLPGQSEIWYYDGETTGPSARSLSIEFYDGRVRVINCVTGLSDCIIAGVKSGQPLADFERKFGPPTSRRSKLSVEYRAQDAPCILTIVAYAGRIEGGVIDCEAAGLPR
jgi:hypothetical protein